jgi:phosphatidylinositol glycan class U
MPALHYLWLGAGSGNANFFYATTLVWAFAGGSAVLDAMWAWGRSRWEMERPIIMIPTLEGKSRKVIQM